MQCWLNSTSSAPVWFTPNLKLRWLKPNPNPSLFMGSWFKFHVLMFIFPRNWSSSFVLVLGISSGAGMPQGTGGQGEVMLQHSGFGGISLLFGELHPSGGWIGWGWGEGKKPVGKAAVLEGKPQNCRRSTKPAPRRDFSMGRLWCDPKVKLSALNWCGWNSN